MTEQPIFQNMAEYNEWRRKEIGEERIRQVLESLGAAPLGYEEVRGRLGLNDQETTLALGYLKDTDAIFLDSSNKWSVKKERGE